MGPSNTLKSIFQGVTIIDEIFDVNINIAGGKRKVKFTRDSDD